MASMFWKRLAQLVLDASDVDLRQFQSRLMEGMRNMPTGQAFATWAAQNPVAFETLVRALSVVTKRSGRAVRERGMIAEALADQLAAMPMEFRRAFSSAKRDDLQLPPSASVVPTPLAPTLEQSLEYLEHQRKQGEFFGALLREFVRGTEPDELPSLVQHATSNRSSMEASKFSRQSATPRSEKAQLVASLVHDISAVGASVDEALSDVDQVETLTDHPLAQAGRKQFADSILIGLSAPESHSPVVPDLSEVAELVRATAFRFKRVRGEDPAVPELLRAMQSVRASWEASLRPGQWIDALDAAIGELRDSGTRQATR